MSDRPDRLHGSRVELPHDVDDHVDSHPCPHHGCKPFTRACTASLLWTITMASIDGVHTERVAPTDHSGLMSVLTARRE